ncbi:molybdate transport system permease protein [Desulfotomaculum arcticum]|uniref:Molybdate transport system permease protein n=1 Tax=Desulfotruncus arcticus DSM 17038 TaxID=1121424 RepID=A0A1I2XA62_9FIRM|nr:ABC transporter permease [Desulfotruncus arcticus]SFH10413.1 molybdate transport system permease protein [Desulfotomaculum arcticum] [Desulfotruncus arcticus DSM 17038]
MNMSGKRITLFQAVFWLVFILMTLFMLALVGGLFLYGKCDAFMNVMRQPELHYAVVFTFWTTLLATILAGMVAVPCGFILSRYDFRGKILVDTLIDVPIVLPPLVSGVALLILFGPVLGSTLTRLGLDIVFSVRGVIVAQWFIATPFAVKTFKQAFDSIDPRLEKIARTLGYSPAGVFFKVTVPMAQKGLIGGLTMAWARTLGEFGATAMLAGIIRMKTETLSVAIFLNMSIGDMHFAIATSIIMLFISMLLLAVFKTISKSEVRL